MSGSSPVMIQKYLMDNKVEKFSKAFAISGYSYQKAKQELREFRDMDPVHLIKRPGRNHEKRRNIRDCMAF